MTLSLAEPASVRAARARLADATTTVVRCDDAARLARADVDEAREALQRALDLAHLAHLDDATRAIYRNGPEPGGYPFDLGGQRLRALLLETEAAGR